jgi:hypothetical protein
LCEDRCFSGASEGACSDTGTGARLVSDCSIFIFRGSSARMKRSTCIANKMRGKQKAPEFPVEPMTRPPIPGPGGAWHGVLPCPCPSDWLIASVFACMAPWRGAERIPHMRRPDVRALACKSIYTVPSKLCSAIAPDGTFWEVSGYFMEGSAYTKRSKIAGPN